MSAVKKDHDVIGISLLIFGILSVVVTVGVSEIRPIMSPDLLAVLVIIELACIVSGLLLLSE